MDVTLARKINKRVMSAAARGHTVSVRVDGVLMPIKGAQWYAGATRVCTGDDVMNWDTGWVVVTEETEFAEEAAQ